MIKTFLIKENVSIQNLTILTYISILIYIRILNKN